MGCGSKIEYHRRKEAHVCVSCGQPDELTLAGGARCKRCLEYNRDWKRMRYRSDARERAMTSKKNAELRERRLAAHICVRCGKAPAITGQTMCKKCRNLNRIECKAYRRKLAAGSIKNCPYAAGLEDLGEYACLHCPRPTCVYDREDEG